MGHPYFKDSIRPSEVFWVDAGLETVRLGFDEVKEISPMPRRNAGYIVHQDAEKLILAFGEIKDREHHNQCWDVSLVIPAGCIVRVEELSD